MKLYSVFLSVCPILFGGVTPLFSQQAESSTIQLNGPYVINFKQLADYQLTHPKLEYEQRFIEQGEDREDKPVFTPRVISSDAKKFDVTLKQNNLRTTSPAPSITFNGTLDGGFLIPPDISGAAGNNYLMETTNQEFDIYTKSGSLNNTLDIATFFSPANGYDYFDPHVVYDAGHQRFIVCCDGFYSNNHSAIFIGVSQDADPTGAWYIYSFDATGNTEDFLDFPQIGFNNKWIVITGNDFLGYYYGTTTKIYVCNRADMYNGSAGTVHTFDDPNVFGITPSVTADTTQATEYMVADWDGNSGGYGYVKISRITGPVNSPSYSAGNTIGVNQPWDENTVNAPQDNSSHELEVADTRISTPIYINGSLWFTHSVFLPAGYPDYAGVDWWQVDPSNSTLLQFGRLEDISHSIFYFYPSLCVNNAGDALLGYSVSSSGMYASAQYSFHASGDSLNVMEDGYLFKSGLASYWKDFGSGRNRWGDYTATCVDPVDNSFWTFQEFADAPANSWGTVVTNVGGVPCADIPAAGFISGTPSVCPGEGALLNLEGYTNGVIGIQLQWQQSANGISGWANANGFGSTSSAYQTGSLDNVAFYRCIITCSASAGSDTTLAFEVKVNGFVSVANDTICSPGITSLITTANTPVSWFETDTSSVPFFTGDTLQANVTGDTTFYINTSTLAFHSVGIANSGNGSYYNFTYGAGLVFNALSNFILDTVFVYPNSTGIIKVNLINASLGTVIDSVSQTITSGQVQNKTAIPLSFNVAAGGTYHLNAEGSTVSSIYRTSSGAVYPYQVPGIVSITQAINGADGYYYFFYDWRIQSGCVSDMFPVSVHIDVPTVLATASADSICFGDGVVLTATGALIYLWQPGNVSGSSFSSEPLSNTTYTVVGTDAYGCSNSSSVDVAVITCAVEIPDAINSIPSLHLFPNPASGTFNLQLEGVRNGSYTITLLNTLGQQVMQMQKNTPGKGTVIPIDATALAGGIYFVRVTLDGEQWMARLIKQ